MQLENVQANRPYSRVFPVPMQPILESLQRILSVYTIKDSQTDGAGKLTIVTTEFIMGERHNPELYEIPDPPANYAQVRSSLQIRAAQGAQRGKTATKVEVTKTYQVREEHHGWVNQATDGLEETVLLDQINEELLNMLALKQAMKKKRKMEPNESDEDPTSLE